MAQEIFSAREAKVNVENVLSRRANERQYNIITDKYNTKFNDSVADALGYTNNRWVNEMPNDIVGAIRDFIDTEQRDFANRLNGAMQNNGDVNKVYEDSLGKINDKIHKRLVLIGLRR